MMSVIWFLSALLLRRVTYRQLFGHVVAFDMRRFFAHKDQTAVVMYILDCLRRVQP